MKRLGFHYPYTKKEQLLGTVKLMVEFGSSTGALYVGSSRSYKRTYTPDLELARQAKELAKENKINLEELIVHAPLLVNLANTEKSYILKSSMEVMKHDMESMKILGLKLYNFHPGSNANTDAGIKQIQGSINTLLEETKDTGVILLLETMMHKGNYIGKNFEQISEIISGVKDKKRIGVCLDTCHIWDAGYNLNDVESVITEFNKVIGINYLKALHVNDSKNKLGSAKDRHENIGEGFIGEKNLKAFINHKLIKNLPMAMEIPLVKELNLEKLKINRDKIE